MMLSIIIVNYNIAKEVDECIESIIKVIKNNYEIIIIDNNSSNRDIELLSPKYPGIKFFLLTENLGFAQANNYAVGKSEGEYILFLNPDTIIVEDFVNPIIEFIMNNKNVGACGPMLLNSDFSYQNSTGITLGFIYETCEAFMLIRYLRLFNSIQIKKKARLKNHVEVSWLSAACLIVSKEIFNGVKGFNSEFFLNYEDIDLCERIRKSGYKNFYFPQLKCIHSDQKSQKRNFEKLVYNRYHGRLIYSKYHYKFFKRSIIKIVHLVGIILRLSLVGIIYPYTERRQRMKGYFRALKLYFQ